jgi:hypothetical protein
MGAEQGLHKCRVDLLSIGCHFADLRGEILGIKASNLL